MLSGLMRPCIYKMPWHILSRVAILISLCIPSSNIPLCEPLGGHRALSSDRFAQCLAALITIIFILHSLHLTFLLLLLGISPCWHNELKHEMREIRRIKTDARRCLPREQLPNSARGMLTPLLKTSSTHYLVLHRLLSCRLFQLQTPGIMALKQHQLCPPRLQ